MEISREDFDPQIEEGTSEYKKSYIPLGELEVYIQARQLSKIAWKIYSDLNWQDKKVFGDQFLSSTDSIGANIAEGYGRFHYLDKIKFYYNARGSFFESYYHWISLMKERGKVTDLLLNDFNWIANGFSVKLNNFISATYNSKLNDKK